MVATGKKQGKKRGKKKPIKVAVLGLGRSGWGIHIKRMRDDARFQITAVTDPISERVDQAVEEFDCAGFSSPAELLESAGAELIVNALPSHLHVPWTLAAFKSGRHVILEKPVAKTVADTRKMINASKRAGKKFFIHHNYRFNPDVRHLREIVESGIIGTLFETRVRGLSFTRRYDWQTLRKFGGGILPNHGTHYIDAIMYVMGDPVNEVWSDLKLVSDVGNTEDHAKIILRTKSGIVADLELSTACALPAGPKWTLLGSYGTASCDGNETTIKYFNPKDLEELKVVTKPLPGRNYDSRPLPWKEKTVPAKPKNLFDFYDNVYEVLRERRAMFVTPESVLDVIKVMEKAGETRVRNVRDSLKKSNVKSKKKK